MINQKDNRRIRIVYLVLFYQHCLVLSLIHYSFVNFGNCAQLVYVFDSFYQLPNHPNITFQFFQWSLRSQMLSVLWKQSMSTQGTTGNHSNIISNISCHEWVIIRSVLNKTVGEWTPLHHFQVQLKIRWDEFTIFSQSLELRILGLQPTTCSPSTCGSTVCSWSWCLALSWLLSLGSWY